MEEEKDFPGGMKSTISAWLPGERYEEGLKIGEKVATKEWPTEGEVIESWKKEEYQFFTFEHLENIFMGVSLCSRSDDRLFQIADKIAREISYKCCSVPGPGLVAKKVIIRNKERISFIFNLSLIRDNNFCTREGRPNIEKILDEAIEEFKKCSFSHSQK